MKKSLSDNKQEAFLESLDLVKRFPSSIPCIRLAQINGWNYARIKCPLMIATLWNKELPKQVKVNEDAFEDRGISPSSLNSEEKAEVMKCMGKELDPMKKGFDPFYEWRFPKPTPSPLAEAHRAKALKEIDEWKKNKPHDSYGYNQGRYMGD